MKNFELHSFASADELASRVANLWLSEIESANRASMLHCVALSGGRIARTFFAATAEQARERKTLFGRVHFFWADERCVPPTDPESNFMLASGLLFGPLKISQSQIHRIRGEEPPVNALEMANEEIQRVVSNCVGERSRTGSGSTRPVVNENANDEASLAARGARALPILDLIFLGMGEDGHVASLFPNAPSEVLNCAVPFLAIENSPKPPPKRISLSYGALAAAKQVWALISGAGKAAALRESLHPHGRTPLARVMQSRSRTKIFCDIS